jgi:hypothetical protein
MSWLLTDAAALEGTTYFEFLPGRYAGECWGPQSVFLKEERFAHIEPLFEKHRPDFDHYAFVEIARSQWAPIVADLSTMADFLASEPSAAEVSRHVGFFTAGDKDAFEQDLQTKVSQLRGTILDLLNWLREKLETHEAISVLGM